MERSLDRKLRILAEEPGADEFILADAKDADMAFGIGAPGLSPEAHAGATRFRTLREYRDIIREMVRHRIVDIVLMSASTSERLVLEERLFDDSPVTPAVRANDASDVFAVRGGRYVQEAAQPFRTATIDHAQCGKADCLPGERSQGVDLGLYSVTFNNGLEEDLRTLEEFQEFRLEAERKGFRYFLEVFDPNVAGRVDSKSVGRFVNDMIARSLAGVTRRGRPIFLKIVYNGPAAMEELFRYDPSLIVGVLGGAAGTTYDAFRLLADSKKYGARAALFGRRINQAENQFAFVRFLRLLADGEVTPEEAVHGYHAVLEKLGVRSHRTLEEDLQITTPALRMGGSERVISIPAKPACDSKSECSCGCGDGSETPNFAAMTSDERWEYHRKRIARLLGSY